MLLDVLQTDELTHADVKLLIDSLPKEYLGTVAEFVAQFLDSQPHEHRNKPVLDNSVDASDHQASDYQNGTTYLPEDSDIYMTEQEVEEQIAYYEQKFGMSSEEFLQSVADGTAPDEDGIISWKLLLKYR